MRGLIERVSASDPDRLPGMRKQSVRTIHPFLSEPGIKLYAGMVRYFLSELCRWRMEKGQALSGFIGAADNKIESRL